MGDDEKTSLTESEVQTMIAAALAGLKSGQDDGGGKKDATTKESAADIAAQVRAELANVESKRKSDDTIKGLTERLAALEAGKSEKEKSPKLFRRIERTMGWRTDDDE